MQVCVDAGFTDIEARVACRSLGFPYGCVAQPYDRFGLGSGAVMLSSLQCDAGAPSLASCSFQLGPDQCYDHSGDVGVVCSTQPLGAVGLLPQCVVPGAPAGMPAFLPARQPLALPVSCTVPLLPIPLWWLACSVSSEVAVLTAEVATPGLPASPCRRGHHFCAPGQQQQPQQRPPGGQC